MDKWRGKEENGKGREMRGKGREGKEKLTHFTFRVFGMQGRMGRDKIVGQGGNSLTPFSFLPPWFPSTKQQNSLTLSSFYFLSFSLDKLLIVLKLNMLDFFECEIKVDIRFKFGTSYVLWYYDKLMIVSKF